MKFHQRPFHLREIKLEVTHDCLLNCVHCSSISSSNTGRQMSYKKCHDILSEAAEMGVKEVAFSGGEPLLWDGADKAVRYAAHLGMDVSLYTTGNVDNAHSKLSDLAKSGLSHAMFSLFGESHEKHEAITMVDGSYKTTIDAAKKCVEIGLDVEFHFVPLPHNYNELRPIAELAKSLGVNRVSVLRLVPQGRGSDEAVSPLNTAEHIALRKLISTLREEGHEIRTGSPFNALMLRDKPQCCSGIDRLTISPTLRISPCDAFKQITCETMGVSSKYMNLAEHSLTECWENSPYLEAVRNYLTSPFAEKCNDCRSLEKCLSGCVAQKVHAHGELAKCPDPMCLIAEQN